MEQLTRRFARSAAGHSLRALERAFGLNFKLCLRIVPQKL